MKKKTVSIKAKDKGTDKTAIGRQEKDIDDLVHDEASETDSDPREQDLDDKVHRIKKSPMDQVNTGMEDPDDLVHSDREEDEE